MGVEPAISWSWRESSTNRTTVPGVADGRHAYRYVNVVLKSNTWILLNEKINSHVILFWPYARSVQTNYIKYFTSSQYNVI